MRINTNISAMNTYGRLTNANAAKSESLSKLSSGLRINKAGDDAAGLAISEKMKGQVGGLNQAVRNAQDGVSLIQTAEGALNETHAILGRMRDLAVQGANGTLSQDDRNEINKEFDALKTEITRISDTTEFNTKKLLNTKDQEFTFQIGANGGQTMSVKIGKMDADSLGLRDSALGAKPADVTDAIINEDSGVIVAQGKVDGINGYTDASSISAAEDSINEATAANDLLEEAASTTINVSDAAAIAALQAKVDAAGGSVTVTGTTSWADITGDSDITDAANDLDRRRAALEGLQVVQAEVGTGATATEIAAAKTKLLEKANVELDAAKAAVGDAAGRENASDAIKNIDDAIKTVSGQRSDLGAAQNRLSHTVKNLTTTKENLAEANSRIRDVDMAEEMMSFTKSNILSQAATSMLSQANAMPNSVLGLLQG
ncbi:flagellin [Enterococcus saccharolyticus]|uniref:flagellin N-terminal helical domain-containing protein n=1 Tax=Enterococcus saccharolyticus TaxID=41997 RepID=UPI0039E00AA6